MRTLKNKIIVIALSITALIVLGCQSVKAVTNEELLQQQKQSNSDNVRFPQFQEKCKAELGIPPDQLLGVLDPLKCTKTRAELTNETQNK